VNTSTREELTDIPRFPENALVGREPTRAFPARDLDALAFAGRPDGFSKTRNYGSAMSRPCTVSAQITNTSIAMIVSDQNG
jgi:hypothetical protein